MAPSSATKSSREKAFEKALEKAREKALEKARVKAREKAREKAHEKAHEKALEKEANQSHQGPSRASESLAKAGQGGRPVWPGPSRWRLPTKRPARGLPLPAAGG